MARALLVPIVTALSLATGFVATGCDEEVPPKTAAGATAGAELPWPLPLPSSSTEIPRDLRATPESGSRLGVAAQRLSRALADAGYKNLRFYDIPAGFALVTPLELIDDQGLATPHPDPAVRFSAAYPAEGLFSMRFWSQLSAGKAGRYRMFVFVVIEHAFGYTNDVTNAQVAWKEPSAKLPQSREDLAYTAQDQWYALVYEVEHPRGTDRVKLVEHPSDPMTHLAKAGILGSLGRLAGASGSGSSPAAAATVPLSVRMPVFVDRTKQVPFERGRARLESIKSTMLSTSLAEAQTTMLGFECASLRAEQKSVANEPDPVVVRFIADVERACGLDVPLATSYVELRAIALKQKEHGSVKSECFGLKVAIGDFGAQYTSNPQVAEVGGKFAALCTASE